MKKNHQREKIQLQLQSTITQLPIPIYQLTTTNVPMNADTSSKTTTNRYGPTRKVVDYNDNKGDSDEEEQSSSSDSDSYMEEESSSDDVDDEDNDEDDDEDNVASKTSKKRVRTKTKSSKPDKKKSKKVDWKDEETIDESTGLLKLSSSEEANAALVGSEITVAAHGRGKIIAYLLRGGVFKGQFKCLFNGKVIFIDIDESDLQNSTPSCAAEDQFRYLSAEEGIVVVQHDRDADKTFLTQYLCDHLLSRGKEIDLDKEYPRLNRHVQKVVKKSLSEYLNVKDQDQLELYLRMKNVASLWANDIIQQKIR